MSDYEEYLCGMYSSQRPDSGFTIEDLEHLKEGLERSLEKAIDSKDQCARVIAQYGSDLKEILEAIDKHESSLKGCLQELEYRKQREDIQS